MLNLTYPNLTPILYGNRDSFIFSYHGNYEYRRLTETVAASATSLRDAAHSPEDSTSFRKGIIYASRMPYPTSYQAVDVAILNKDRVLLGSKSVDGGLYRFIGGFVDPADLSLEHAARREASEETGMMNTDEYEYLGSARIDDFRYRNTEHALMSAFFKAKYIWGAPTAGDDLESCAWIHIDHMMNCLVPQHKVLGQLLLSKGIK